MNKKLAVVVNGWHFPKEFYKQIKEQKIPDGWEIDYFCVSHRDPEVSKSEKQKIIPQLGDSILEKLDKVLYKDIATVEYLEKNNWQYSLEPNTIGDWGCTNQWLEKHPNYRDYEILLLTHDDNWVIGDDLFECVLNERLETLYRNNISVYGRGELQKTNKAESSEVPYEEDWLVISNGLVNSTAKVRGSFDFFKTSLIEKMGGSFDLSRVELSRVGETDNMGVGAYGTNPPPSGMSMKDWEKPVQNYHNFMYQNKLVDKVRYLSPTYRVSYWCLEGERGLLSNRATPQRVIYESGVNDLINMGRIS